ncbi:hypothetical protein LJC72_02635 [Bacteroides sp. OttesenSCG-928-D19]|nr:hypothetical protein [Bacteroides sp. OttesenSCG-928-N06]MDL2304221.1 hypothetical protein [Bacteroides sp. OttesenSCG-928-D19]
MTPKLPVKIYKLRLKKKIGLVLFILSHLFMMIFFMQLGYTLIKSPGRIVCAIIVLFSFAMVFFGILAFIRLAQEKFIGFFISSDGLNDISTGHNYGVVMWRDVTKIRILTDVEHPKRKYIVLKVKNPQEYIERETSHSKRRSMTLKMHYYGSPICFSNRGMDCTFQELEDSVRTYYANYKQRQEEKPSF